MPTPPPDSGTTSVRNGGRLWVWPMIAAAVVLVAYAINVNRYWFLGDDAFISFRYSRNLADGLGVVWNLGEFVEGYTNFLWVLILALGMRLGIEPEGLSTALGVLSGVGALLLLGVFAARRRGWRDPLVWLPLLALGLSRSFTAWSTGGLATQAFTLLVLAAQLRFIRERDEPSRSVFPSSLLFALATLTRPEGGLFTAAAGLLFLFEVVRGRRKFGDLCLWVLPWAILVGGHFLWRHSYYGAWLPNTFHAKVNGFWPHQAQHYFALFHEDYRLGYALPLIALALWRRGSFAHWVFTWSALVYCAYVVAIGGDRFEFRFLVVLLPACYWLISEGIDCVVRWTAGQPSVGWRRGLGLGLSVLLLASTHWGSVRPEALDNRHHIESIQHTRVFGDRRALEGRVLRSYIDAGVLPADLMLCVGGAGALPYYTRWPSVDFWGLNDPVIAQAPVEGRGVIAHEHRATAAYLRQRGVVVYDSMNQLLFHEDPMRLASKTVRRAEADWKLRAVRLGEHVMVFSTTVSEAEFQEIFGNLEILF